MKPKSDEELKEIFTRCVDLVDAWLDYMIARRVSGKSDTNNSRRDLIATAVSVTKQFQK